MARPELSLVIPIYNEEEVLPQLDVRLKELLAKLAIDTEVVFVNDGSKDRSIEILRRMASHELRYRVIGFSRNFGHQRAITAGMEKSRGRAVVVMDADLQDPPEVILEMVEKWREGYDVVYGRRRSREGESSFKLLTAKVFYRVFAAMIPIEVPLDTGDFRLMSRRVVQTMRGLRETHRFVRGLVAWVGFKQTAVEYDRAARAAGETKYPLKKMLAFAMDGIASFSIQPLRFATYIGVFVGAASVLYACAAALTWWAGHTVPGWTTTVILVSFLSSVQFFMIGVLGEYVGRIYEQVKRRPLYIISERINFGRRKVEKLVTSDLEELQAASMPPVAAASSGEIPAPPPAVVAAGAAAEASLSRTPPPVTAKTGRPPPVTAKLPPKPSGSKIPAPPAPRPGTPSVLPPPVMTARSTSVAPPAPTPSVPPVKGASMPPPKPATTRSASIPPKAIGASEGGPTTTKADGEELAKPAARDVKSLFGSSRADDGAKAPSTSATTSPTETASPETKGSASASPETTASASASPSTPSPPSTNTSASTSTSTTGSPSTPPPGATSDDSTKRDDEAGSPD